VFASAFDDLLHALPDGWRTATFDVRVENALDPGRHNIGADGAADCLASCRPRPGPDRPNSYRFCVSSDGSSGVVATHADHAMRQLDAHRLRGEVLLVDVETTNPTALQRWNRPDNMRAFGPERRAVVETPGGGFRLGPAA
jgi:hypothetical protein